MKKAKSFHLTSYLNWNHEIYTAMAKFMKSHGIAPQILLSNSATAIQIDMAMSAELLGKGAVDNFKSMGVFACSLGEVVFCTDDLLPNGKLVLIYDDEAEIVEAAEQLEEELVEN